MQRAYVFKLYPTRAQHPALVEQLDTHRHLYNRALAERKTAWETEQRTLTYGEQSATLKGQRATNPFMARVNFSSCQRTLKRLERAFGAFFRRVKAGAAPGYPRFKGRHRFDTVEYTHTDGCRFFGTSLYVQHVGRLKVKQHRPVEGSIKAVSVTRKADGWHCVLVCDQGEPDVLPSTPAGGRDRRGAGQLPGHQRGGDRRPAAGLPPGAGRRFGGRSGGWPAGRRAAPGAARPSPSSGGCT